MYVPVGTFSVVCSLLDNLDIQKEIEFALCNQSFVGLAYQGNHILFRFIIEYSSLRDFAPRY
jgi:hypothetical protein